jgi:hypothetical protein
MPQLLAELFLGNTGVNGNLFLRNRLNLYIIILPCLPRQTGKQEVQRRQAGWGINNSVDGQMDCHTNKESGNKRKNRIHTIKTMEKKKA